MSTFVRRVRSRLSETLSGDSDGTPCWVTGIKKVTTLSLRPELCIVGCSWSHARYGRGHHCLADDVAHPGAMAGFHDWSGDKKDLLRRLSGTISWLITATFGYRALAEYESNPVARFDNKVHSTYTGS